MVLLFPGLLYVLYDCLLYVVRALVYTAFRGPVLEGGSVTSSSDDDGEEGEVKAAGKQM